MLVFGGVIKLDHFRIWIGVKIPKIFEKAPPRFQTFADSSVAVRFINRKLHKTTKMACAQDKESWTYIDDNILPQKKHVELKDISGSSKSCVFLMF